MKQLIKLSRQLSRVKRFQVYNLFNTYNVAEHSYRVAMLCYIIGNSESKKIRMEAIQKALFHDLEEAILGDFPGPLKRRNKDFNKCYDKLAEDIMSEQTDGKDSEEYELWKTCKEDKSGEIVHLADNLEAFETIVEEVESGNLSAIPILKRFLDEIYHIFPKDILLKYDIAKIMVEEVQKRGEICFNKNLKV